MTQTYIERIRAHAQTVAAAIVGTTSPEKLAPLQMQLLVRMCHGQLRKINPRITFDDSALYAVEALVNGYAARQQPCDALSQLHEELVLQASVAEEVQDDLLICDEPEGQAEEEEPVPPSFPPPSEPTAQVAEEVADEDAADTYAAAVDEVYEGVRQIIGTFTAVEELDAFVAQLEASRGSTEGAESEALERVLREIDAGRAGLISELRDEGIVHGPIAAEHSALQFRNIREDAGTAVIGLDLLDLKGSLERSLKRIVKAVAAQQGKEFEPQDERILAQRLHIALEAGEINDSLSLNETDGELTLHDFAQLATSIAAFAEEISE